MGSRLKEQLSLEQYPSRYVLESVGKRNNPHRPIELTQYCNGTDNRTTARGCASTE